MALEEAPPALWRITGTPHQAWSDLTQASEAWPLLCRFDLASSHQTLSTLTEDQSLQCSAIQHLTSLCFLKSLFDTLESQFLVMS